MDPAGRARPYTPAAMSSLALETKPGADLRGGYGRGLPRDIVRPVLSPPAPSAEQHIVAIARHRDKAAFAELFRAWAPRIRHFLMKRGVDGGQADELGQEVMLLVWRKAEHFDPARGAAATWLFTLTRNVLVDRVRAERRPVPDPEPAGETVTTDERLAFAQDGRRLESAIAQLPQEQAEVVRGAYFEGLSLSEIAARSKLPLGTVKTRARLALQRLRATFVPEEAAG